MQISPRIRLRGAEDKSDTTSILQRDGNPMPTAHIFQYTKPSNARLKHEQ